MNYAILRCEKVKSKSDVSGSAKHDFREQATPNANPLLTKDNQYLHGARNSDELFEALDSRLATQKHIRKNAVLVLDYLITCSPESSLLKNEKMLNAYFQDGLAWLKDKHGAENILYAVVHLDEKTPHLSVKVVPIDPKGKLNAAYFRDGRKLLEETQTDFFEKVGAKQGLQRGIQGSKAKHQDIDKWYAHMQTPDQPLPPQPKIPREPTFVEKLSATVGLHTEHADIVQSYEAKVIKRQQTIKKRNEVLKTKAKAFDAANDLNKRIAERSKLLDERESQLIKAQKQLDKQTLDNLRQIELPVVLIQSEIGGIRSSNNRNIWKTKFGEVEIKDNCFIVENDSKPKRKNAIDLVMYAFECTFDKAIQWLATKFRNETVLNTAKKRLEDRILQYIDNEQSPDLTIKKPIPAPVEIIIEKPEVQRSAVIDKPKIKSADRSSDMDFGR